MGGMNYTLYYYGHDLFMTQMLVLDTFAENPDWEEVEIQGVQFEEMVGQRACIPFLPDAYNNDQFLIFGGIPPFLEDGKTVLSDEMHTLKVKEIAEGKLEVTLEKLEQTLQVRDRIYFNQYFFQKNPKTGQNLVIVPSREAAHVFEQSNGTIKYLGSDLSRRYTNIVDPEHL